MPAPRPRARGPAGGPPARRRRREGPRNAPPARVQLGLQLDDLPAVAASPVDEADVQPVRTVLPELDLVRHEAVCAPERRPLHLPSLELPLELPHALLELL